MKTLQFAAVVALSVSSSGCAIFSAATNGNLAGAAEAAKKEAALMKESGDYGDRECAPIKTTELSWEEERAVGGAVGVGLATKGGHFYVEGATEKNPETLAADLSKAKLPDNVRNELTAYLSVVGRNLAHYSSRPELPWTFGVIENDTPNAFSAPGGYVFVTTGLLKKITNEAQLAGVFGHEIGHVVGKHSLKRYKSAKFTQCAVALTAGYYADRSSNVPDALREPLKFSKKFEKGGKVNLDAPDDGGFVGFVVKKVLEVMELLGNETSDEFEADATALELVSFAGYDASEYEKFLTSLGNSGGGFSKHPSTNDRVAKLKALREGDLAPFASGTAKPDVAKAFAPLKK